MASWKKVIVSGSNANLTALSVDNLTSGQVVIGGGTGNLSTTAINGTGTIVATTGASGLSHSGSFSGSFQGTISGGNAFIQGGNSFGTTALLGTNDTQNLQFETSGSVRMTISSSGTVGIGTTSPTSASLVVNSPSSGSDNYITQFQGGGLQRFNFTSDGIMYWGLSAVPSSANGYLSWDTTKAILAAAGNTNNLSFVAGLSERMFISSSGNVGIGTNAPSAKFHVVSTAVPSSGEEIARFGVSDDLNSYFRVYNSTQTNGSYVPTIEGKNSGTNIGIGIIGNGTTDTGNIPLTVFDARIGSASVSVRPLFQWNNYDTAQMTMRADGNLGIGITNPTSKLHVAHQNAYDLPNVIIGETTNTNGRTSGLELKTNNGGTAVSSSIIFDYYGTYFPTSSEGAYSQGLNYVSGRSTFSNHIFRDSSLNTLMMIDNTGSVGIGITTPSAKLHVTNVANNNSFLVEDSTNPDVTPFVIDKDGNVGIGTTTPSSSLTLHGSDRFITTAQTTHGWGNTNTIGVAIGTSNAGIIDFRRYTGGLPSDHSVATIEQEIIGGNWGLAFKTDYTSSNVRASSTRMLISNVGNVGIGTTTPTTRLTVSGNMNLTSSTTTTLNIRSGAGVNTYIGSEGSGTSIGNTTNHSVNFIQNNIERARFDTTGNFGIGITTPSASLHVTNTTTSASLLVDDSTNPDSSPFIIDNTGQVGIGTLTPRTALDVNGRIFAGDVWTETGFFLGNLNTGASYAYMSGNGASSTNSNLDFSTNATSRLTITHAGNVGIGTTTPNSKLDVNGNTIITGSLIVTAGITGSLLGTASTASFVTASGVFGPFGANSVVSASRAVSAAATAGTLTFGEGLTAGTFNGSSNVTMTISGAAQLTDNAITKWNNTDNKFVVSSLTDNGTVVSGASSIQLTGAASALTGSFTGSFKGDGSQLTGIATTLSINAGSGGPSTVALASQTLTIAGTSNEVETSVSGQTITIGLPNDVTIGNSLTVTGDLYVNGTTTTVNTTDLLIEDKFILLASGSANSVDSGIIIDRGAYSNQNVAFGYDSTTVRWGLQSNVTDSASTMTIGTDGNSAFIGTVFTEATHTSKPTSGEFVVPGAIYTAADETIWMYS